METLYRPTPALPSSSLDWFQNGSPRYFEPVKGLTESGAMTAMCLWDALCDFEHSAGFRRGIREAGGDPLSINKGDHKGADLGDLIGELRSEQGSFQTRQDVLDIVTTVDDAWDRVNSDDACDGAICFDFEFCPEAIRLRFKLGLTGADLEDALVNWGRDKVDEENARWVAIRAKEDRAGAIAKAQAGLAQAEAALAALLASEVTA
jgi:hypothetical protein